MLTVGTVLPALFTLGAVLLLSSPTVKKNSGKTQGLELLAPARGGTQPRNSA